MSEGTPATGWVGRVRDVIYARLEETSFRSGAAAGAALVVAGLAVALAVTLGGHRVPLRATAAGAALPSAQPSGVPSPAGLARSTSPSARRIAPAPWSSAAADDVPEAQVTPATAAPMSPWLPTHWQGRHHRRPPPGWPYSWPASGPPPRGWNPHGSFSE